MRAGQQLDFAAMLAYLEERKLIEQYRPGRVEVISELPRTPSGKIQKFRLRELARALTPMRVPASN